MGLVRRQWGEVNSTGQPIATIKECLIMPSPDSDEAQSVQLLALPTDLTTKFLFSTPNEEYFVLPRVYDSETGKEVQVNGNGAIRWSHQARQLVFCRETKVQPVFLKAVCKSLQRCSWVDDSPSPHL